MKSALEMSYGDRAAAFDLCWQMTSAIRTRFWNGPFPIGAKSPLRIWCTCCSATARQRSPVRRTASQNCAPPDDLPLLYAATDALLDAGRRARGGRSVAGSRQPPAGRSHASEFRGAGVSQGFGHGFDWRIAETPGVTQLALDTPPSHRIRFSGQQPESCELLRQVVGGLRAGAAYTLHWEARTAGNRFAHWIGVANRRPCGRGCRQ